MRKTLVVLLVVSSMLQSCIFAAGPIAKSQAKKNLTTEKKAIPPDLGKEGTYVVCILQERESRDKYLRKYFNENYKGNFVFSTKAELTTKYADVEKYRYMFTYARLEGQVYHVNDGSTTTVPSSNYFIYDRKADIEYNSGFHSGFFGKTIDAYTANMEVQRLANQ